MGLEERIPASLATRALDRALRSGGDFAELYAEERVSHAVSSDDGRIDRVTSGLQRGVGVRVSTGGFVALAFSESLEQDALLSAADAAREAARGGPRGTVVPCSGGPAGPVAGAALERDRAARVELVMRGDRAARAADPRIGQVTVFLGTIRQEVLVASSEGRYVTDVRPRLRYRVQAVARNGSGERVGIGTYAPGVSWGFEFLERTPPEAIARRAADQALVQLDAGPAPAGVMPVVLGSGVGGVLVHEACGHGLEADSVLRGASIFAGRVGEQVAAPAVTIVDDGTVDGGWGSTLVDDEGETARRTPVVERGTLTTFLHDRLTASAMGAAPTGNSRRASFRHLPLPRMTNTFIEPGSASPEEIIAETAHGLYARSLSGGQMNPASGIFLFTVREGYEIRAGRVDHPVVGATVAGRAIAALQAVDLVGRDFELVAGNCAREGQRVFVGIGQGTLRIGGLLVGGSASGATPTFAAAPGWRGFDGEADAPDR